MKQEKYHTDGLITKRGTCLLEDFLGALRDYFQSRVARFLQFRPWSGQIMVQIWIAIETNIKVHPEHKRGNAM